jgi:hypothetical protein
VAEEQEDWVMPTGFDWERLGDRLRAQQTAYDRAMRMRLAEVMRPKWWERLIAPGLFVAWVGVTWLIWWWL